MVVEPNSDPQTQGTTRTRIVRLIRAPGFNSPVQLSLYQPQSGITAAFNPMSISGDTSFMALTVGDSVALGTKNLTVVGTQGNITRVAFFTVDVVADQYIVRLTPDTLRLTPGQNTQVTVNVEGSHLPATLSAPNEPNVVSFALSPNPTSSTSTMTVSVNSQAPAGTRRIPVTGTFSDGQTARDTLTLNIDPSIRWVEIFRTPPTHYLYAMSFAGNNGLAVGTPGIVYRSTDRGQTWPPPTQSLDPSTVLFDVALLNNGAISVAINRRIFHSQDYGTTWTEAQNPSPNAMAAVSWCGADTAIAVAGNSIIRTTNMGNQWTLFGSVVAGNLSDVACRNRIAIAVGDPQKIIRSTDAGVSWMDAATTSVLMGRVSLADENNGMAVGAIGRVMVTADGGVSWTNRNLPPTGITLNAVFMLNQNVAVVGGNGSVFFTTDRGQTWTSESMNVSPEQIWSLQLFSDGTGLCVVGMPGGYSVIPKRAFGL